jgi:hypothetical protein
LTLSVKRVIGIGALVAGIFTAAAYVGQGAGVSDSAKGSRDVPSKAKDPPDTNPDDGTPAYLDLDVVRECVNTDVEQSDKPIPLHIYQFFGDAPRAIRQEVLAIAYRVEQLRGHRFTNDFKTEFPTRRELQKRLKEQSRSTSESKDELAEKSLVLLGITKPSDRIGQIRKNYVANVAAYYQPAKNKLVAPVGAAKKLDAAGKSTLAHELEHALVDQIIGIGKKVNTDSSYDESIALSAVVEGSATLLQIRFEVSSLSFAEQNQASTDTSGSGKKSDRLPYLVEQQQLFPYLGGLQFVCGLYERGGWKAVNRAFDNPPKSTAEVLFPTRFRSWKPVRPPRLDAPGPSWTTRPRADIGATDLLWLFEAPGDKRSAALDSPLDGAATWAGGELYTWTKGDRTSLGFTLVERGNGGVLCDYLFDWYEAMHSVRWPQDEDATRTGTTLELRGSKQSATGKCTGRNVELRITSN